MNDNKDIMANYLYQTKCRKDKGAFTLIELSIVLVIIGLIVGGVLVGKDLIKAAEIRSQVSQIEKTNVAVNTFKLKYNCLAGDCANATQFFDAASQPEKVTNGNGDGIVCGYCSTPIDTQGWNPSEGVRGWDHLAAAGLIKLAQFDEVTADVYLLPDVGFPKLKITSKGSGPDIAGHTYRQGGIFFGYEPAVSYDTGGNRIRLGACETRDIGWNANVFGFQCGLNPSEAFSIDTKIDDGKPYSGNMAVTAPFYIYRIPGWSGSVLDDTNYCGTYATNTYRNNDNTLIANNTARGCSPSIRAQF